MIFAFRVPLLGRTIAIVFYQSRCRPAAEPCLSELAHELDYYFANSINPDEKQPDAPPRPK